jgi:hypothetical protein
MWGDFQVIILYFKYGGLIDKKFDVKKGGSLSWEPNESTTEFSRV